ncbi:MAG: TIGR04282 family arsenosugar biosynthesis glycosyltransferase [Ktedonobacteraceae bacterium]
MSDTNNETALIVMARYPELGKIKTRLARTLGEQETLGLYRAFLDDIVQHHSGQAYTLCWAYTPSEVNYQEFVTTLAPEYATNMRCFPQQGTELGARIHSAFQWTHEQGFAYTILIGSDSPQIRRESIEKARRALDEVDVVLGPCDDGGYYLLGMRIPHDVFSGIPMSTDVVTQMTIEVAQRQSLTVRLIDSLFDVDELPDLVRLAHMLTIDPTLAPVTAAHLKTMRSFHDNHAYTTDDTSDSTTALNLPRANQPM